MYQLHVVDVDVISQKYLLETIYDVNDPNKPST